MYINLYKYIYSGKRSKKGGGRKRERRRRIGGGTTTSGRTPVILSYLKKYLTSPWDNP
jgi:hypothetical protein